MGLPRMRFPIWRLMTLVAIVACSTAAAIAFSAEPNTAGSVLTGWAALYGVPAFLILARGVPLGRAVEIRRGGSSRSVCQSRACVGCSVSP